ncbi:MAG: protein phosphatase, partial [Alishewanella aestuarii]
MAHPYDVLLLEQVRLIFTPCPGTKGTSVAEALATLKAAGAKAVLTLTSASELAALKVTDLAEQCAAAGL